MNGETHGRNAKNKLTNQASLFERGLAVITTKEINQMKKLFTSTLLAAVAVPFLAASPAPKKAQNTATDTTATTTTKTKKTKRHHKKTSATESGTTSTAPQSK